MEILSHDHEKESVVEPSFPGTGAVSVGCEVGVEGSDHLELEISDSSDDLIGFGLENDAGNVKVSMMNDDKVFHELGYPKESVVVRLGLLLAVEGPVSLELEASDGDSDEGLDDGCDSQGRVMMILRGMITMMRFWGIVMKRSQSLVRVFLVKDQFLRSLG
jgi:hypothetical protein